MLPPVPPMAYHCGSMNAGFSMATTDNKPTVEQHQSARWRLLRDIGVLQVKLIVDGFRDLILVPLSLIAGAVGLMRGGSRPGQEFYDLLRAGKQSERWINLFGAVDAQEEEAGASADETDLDQMVGRIETFVVDEYRHGHISKQAKEKLDRAVERLQKAAGRNA